MGLVSTVFDGNGVYHVNMFSPFRRVEVLWTEGTQFFEE